MNSYGPTAQYPAGFDVSTGKPITTAAGAAADAALAAQDAAALDALYGSLDTGSGVSASDLGSNFSGAMSTANQLGSNSPTASGMSINVWLNGQAVGNAITSAQVDQSATGIPNSFQRSGYGSGALPW